MLSQGRKPPRLGYGPTAARQPATRRQSRPDFLNDYLAAVPGVHRNPAAFQQFHAQEGLVYGLENLNFVKPACHNTQVS